jgi:arsenate reductase
MAELGIDVSGNVPRQLTDLARQADVIVIIGCGDHCPFIPGRRYLEWNLEDPRAGPSRKCDPPETSLRRVEELVAELDAAARPT